MSIIPADSDWGGLKATSDQKRAHKIFGGHSNEEMQAHFREHVTERADELRSMPPIPFLYYMLGFRDFVMAKKFAKGDPGSDAASCFLKLVLEKLERNPKSIVPIMTELFPAIEFVARNQAAYGADSKIYGDFREKLARIEALYSLRDR